MKCKTCKVHEEICRSAEPACCVWFMDNVVIGGKSVDECPVYEPVKADDTEAFNDFESPEEDEDYDSPDENGGYVVPF